MIIYQDTREHKQEAERVANQIRAAGCEVIRSKLYVGDYLRIDDGLLVIDRKKDLLELCGNVTQQHERFRCELLKARAAGIKIVILCEHGEEIKTLEDVFFWHNPRKDIFYWTTKNGKRQRLPKYPNATEGEQLYKSLCTMRDRYGVSYEFCDKQETGARIVKILGGENA